MYRGNNTRFAPIIIIVVVTIALIFGLVVVGRQLFFNGGSSEEVSQIEAARKDLLTVNDNRSVEMAVRGPIVANEDFQSYRISISPDSRDYTTFKSYGDDVTSEKTLPNTSAAYEQFVYALDKADFTVAGKQAGQPNSSDTRGICAVGKLYTFTIYDGSQIVSSHWTSTCAGSPGTFGASVSQVGNLFAKQIPGLDAGFGNNIPRL